MVDVIDSRGTVKVVFKDDVIAKITFDQVNIVEEPEVKDVHILMLKGEDGKDGESDYELLEHKPQINGVELLGNKSSSDLNIDVDIDEITNSELEEMLKL